MTNRSLLMRVLFENLAVAVLIHVSTWSIHGLLASEHSPLSPLRPAPGIALAAALLLGWRVAPGIVLPMIASSMGAGDPLFFSILAPMGFVVSVYFGRGLLLWRKFDPQLGATKDVLALAGFGAALPMGLGGLWTAGCMMAAEWISLREFWTVASIHWVANTAGIVVVSTVILLLAAGRFSPRRIGLRWAVEAAIQLALAFLAAWLAFFGSGNGDASTQALAYLSFPFLVWVALSRGLAGAAVAVLGIVGLAVVAASMGTGPFGSQPPLAAFWQIEVFIAIITTSGLLIGAGSDAQRREKAFQAEAATRKAELERLKAQVNPHFLFNCLTAIHSLVRTDGRAAEQGLASLSSLLCRSLDAAKHPLIPLAEELGIIREALVLQKMRYEEGLEWSVVADKSANDFLVPPMLLQPLVENAVKHGVEEGFGRVDVMADLQEGDLIARVRNTAPPDCDPSKWKESVGLASVRARVAESCPAGSGLEISKTAEGWIEVVLRINPMVAGFR